MSKTFRAVAMVLVLVVGTTGAASALGMRTETPSAGLFDRALGWVVSLISWEKPSPKAVWEEFGGYIDPNGEPRPTSQGDGSDFGGFIDPNG